MRSIAAACLVSPIGFLFSICSGEGFFLIPPFFIYRRVPGGRFSTASPVACPPLSLPSTSQTHMGRAVLGPHLFVLIFFVRFLGICGEPACVPHLSVGRPPQYWRRL